MWTTARRLMLTGAIVAGASLPVAAAAPAQQPDPRDAPRLTTEPPASLRGEPTATPGPAATTTPTADTAPSAASDELPNTGSDARTLALAGLSLLMLGASLRLQLALRDGRD